MASTLISTLKIAFVFICLVFGVDKFFEFLPTCSLVQHISQSGMIATGLIEIILSVLLLFKKYELWVLRIGTGIMFAAMVLHIATGDYHFSGALIGSLIGLFLIFDVKKKAKI